MLRRWSTLLVIWFGLLVGVASPELACATAKSGDCCPQDSTSPCGEEKRDHDLGSLAACCVTAPPAPSAVWVEANRNAADQPHGSGSPDTIVALAWFATLSLHVRAPQSVVPAMSLPRTDAALTWLHTGRLRL